MSVIETAPVFASAAGLSGPGTWATIRDPGEKPSLAEYGSGLTGLPAASFGIPATGRVSRRGAPGAVRGRSCGNAGMQAEPSAPATRSSTIVRSHPVGLVGSGNVVATGASFGRGLAS